jgi:hypothetical protein
MSRLGGSLIRASCILGLYWEIDLITVLIKCAVSPRYVGI